MPDQPKSPPPKALSSDTEKRTLLRKLSESEIKLDERVGFAIVGLGRAGHFHLTSIRSCPDISTLKWVVDAVPEVAERIGKEHNCKYTTNVNDVLADPAVHAVIVASTTNTHYGYCRDVLASGKALFTEKPISHKPDELREIIDTAIAKRRPFLVGYQRRVDANFRALREQLVAGTIGDIRMIKCCSRDNPLPPLPYLRVSGGIFYDMLCHDFDMIHFLSGQFPTEVYSVGHCYDDDIREMDDIDTVMVTLKFASGLCATVDCSRVAEYGYDQRVEVLGKDGMATAENLKESNVIVATSAGFTHARSQWSFPQRYKHTYATEFAEFVAMVQENAIEDDEMILRHIELERVTAAAELSYRLGRAVKIDEVEKLRHHLKH